MINDYLTKGQLAQIPEMKSATQNKQTKLKSFFKFLLFRNMSKLLNTPWKTLRSPSTNGGLSVFQIFHGNEVQFKTKHLVNKQKFFLKRSIT